MTEQPAASVDFRELARLLAAADQDEAAIGEVVARYDLDIDFATIPILAERHCLRLEKRSVPASTRASRVATRICVAT